MSEWLDHLRAELDQATTIEGRQDVLRRLRDPSYRGARHLAIVLAVSMGPALIALACVRSWGWLEVGVVLAGLLTGTSVVYFSHRFPMHRVMPPFRIAYDMHTRCHHMMFTETKFEIATLDDCDMVMLPWRHALGVSTVVVPLLSAPWLLLGWDAALCFAAVSWLYYGLYELVHLAAHAPTSPRWRWIDRTPYLGFLVRHHRAHHAWSKMHHGNFSMLNPLWDVVLGTRLR